jgi:hypothetical protein
VIPSDRPPDGGTAIAIRRITINLNDFMTKNERLAEIWDSRRWRNEIAAVRTKYKRKDQKAANPMNAPLRGGVNPGGYVLKIAEDKPAEGEKGLINAKLRGKVVPRGSRLTPERLAKMRIGTGFLSEAEKQLFIDILFEYEGAIAFDDSEMGQLNPAIEPPIIIHTIPHGPWEQQNLRLPKAMQDAAITTVKEKLANGTLEHSQGPYRGHDALINSLSKYYKGKPESWPKYLSLALWADRISVRRSTGYSAFEILYGRDCLLPVELDLESWSMIDWEAVQTREDLLMARMRQLDQRTLTEAEAARNLRNSRQDNKVYFDQHRRLRPEHQKLRVSDLVLLHDTRYDKDRARARKLNYKWNGPYRIQKIGEDSTFYILEELDGVPLKRSFAGNRLKRFFSRDSLDEHREEMHDMIRVCTDFENMPVEEDNEGEENLEEL